MELQCRIIDYGSILLAFDCDQLLITNTISSVSNVVEFPGSGLGRLRTINSELNGAT